MLYREKAWELLPPTTLLLAMGFGPVPARAGSLEPPPGAPQPTMKTLTQIELTGFCP
jgi:hypothetical protein